MRSFHLLPLVALAFAAPAFAQDDPAAPPSRIKLTGGATLTSDYRYRGISRSNKKVAGQATIGVGHSSGLYAGVWGSTVSNYVASGADAEIDLYAGYKYAWKGFAFDLGMLYYVFPGAAKNVKTDFFEPYFNVSRTFGPVGFKLGENFAWKQRALATPPNVRGANTYFYGEIFSAIPHTGLTVTGHLGHTIGPSKLTFGRRNYTDWSLGAAYNWKHLTVGVAYVDTNLKRGQIVGPAATGSKNLASAGVVATAGVHF